VLRPLGERALAHDAATPRCGDCRSHAVSTEITDFAGMPRRNGRDGDRSTSLSWLARFARLAECSEIGQNEPSVRLR